jgi:hypothetical protein
MRARYIAHVVKDDGTFPFDALTENVSCWFISRPPSGMTMVDPTPGIVMLPPPGHAIGSPFGHSQRLASGAVGCVPRNAFSPGRVPPHLPQLRGERNITFTAAGVYDAPMRLDAMVLDSPPYGKRISFPPSGWFAVACAAFM